MSLSRKWSWELTPSARRRRRRECELISEIQMTLIAFFERSAKANGHELVYDNDDGWYRFKRGKGMKHPSLDTRFAAEDIAERLLKLKVVTHKRLDQLVKKRGW